MMVMCSSPLLMPEFRTNAGERKSFTMGRNTSKEGGDISRAQKKKHEKQDDGRASGTGGKRRSNTVSYMSTAQMAE